MTRPHPHLPGFDLTTLHFPSDEVTIGAMRAEQPHLYDEGMHVEPNPESVTIYATMETERMLARKAFASAAGLTDPDPDQDRREMIVGLDADYQLYGISSGLKQTYLRVRAFEAAAARQAAGRGR